MTTNFGCSERRTMASQPSVHNEERNRLRLRAWEQRNQETSQPKELCLENVPLFGEPYKTNKGDELSNRIQRMLGHYEDVNNPYPVAMEPLPIPTYVTSSQSDQGQPNADNPTKPPFHNQVPYVSSQNPKPPSTNGYSSQPTRVCAASSSSPHRHGHSSTRSDAPLSHGQLSQSAHQQKKSEADLRERVGRLQEMSPDAKPLPFLRSSSQDNANMETRDAFDRHQLQGSTDRPSECASTVDASTFNLKQSPKDASLPQANKGNVLPTQSFPLLLSKQPSVVMTQKPTAYVRPMDGQDQVVSESPELKPSPEPYVPLPELISKSDLGKVKTLPPFLETKVNEAQCVEDILREMTHSWPPLLTTIDTPSTSGPPKSPFPVKEAEHVSSCTGQKNYNSSPADPLLLIQQSSSSSVEAAHSRGVDCVASSSDPESSSRSDSDSESTSESPRRPASNPVKTEPDPPAVTQVDWQLGNWIRSSLQNSSAESQNGAQASESPAQKQPPPNPSSKHSSVEVVDSNRKSTPQPSAHQKEFPDGFVNPQQQGGAPQDGFKQPSSQTSTELNICSRKLSCTTISSKPAKAVCTEAALGVKCEDVVAPREKDPCFTDRPKVKTKAGHGKKSKEGSDTKKGGRRTSKHAPLDKRKAKSEPDAAPVLHGHCPSCGVRYPNPCSCPTQSPAQPGRLSPIPPAPKSYSKPKSEAVGQKASKTPHKTTQKPPEKTGQAAKRARDPHRPPRSLMVKIDLSLLLRVPQTPNNHQEAPADAKRSVLVVEQDGRAGDPATKQKPSKNCKKSLPQNVEVDNKAIPRKKPRLENKNTSSSRASVKLETSSAATEDRERKKAKKDPLQQPVTSKGAAKDSKSHKRGSEEASREAAKSKDSGKQRRSSGKHGQQEKKPPKSSVAPPASSQPTREAVSHRPLFRFEDRQHPVKHYIKEAKKLKHKADADADKLSKAFSYLEAAMFFVESGIAMEKDPQISMSSYTMFAETVELLKFVLKLKNSVDSSTPPAEKDFIALCLKCQSLLQMAMFRHKHKTALKYSKTLSDHFSNSAQKTHDSSVAASKAAVTPSPMSNMSSPANASTSTDPAGGTVAVPQAIEKVAFSYVNITTLFLSAHDIWEQAEELGHKGSGLLTELDSALAPLSLTSSMSSMVQYTRQAVHWLRLDSQKGK